MEFIIFLEHLCQNHTLVYIFRRLIVKRININTIELQKYLKTETLYFHDSNLINFNYTKNNIIAIFKKYDKSIVELNFESVTKIEFREGDSKEIDFRNRILDLEIKPNKDGLIASILMLNMSFIDIHCTNILLLK